MHGAFVMAMRFGDYFSNNSNIDVFSKISPSQLEPSEADAIKLADLVERVRTKLQEQSDSRKMERNGERLKLFDPTFDMLNELYLVTRTIKDARYEGTKSFC